MWVSMYASNRRDLPTPVHSTSCLIWRRCHHNGTSLGPSAASCRLPVHSYYCRGWRTGPSLHNADARLADGDISSEPNSGPCIGCPESSCQGRVRVRHPKGWKVKTALAHTPRVVCANVQVLLVDRDSKPPFSSSALDMLLVAKTWCFTQRRIVQVRSSYRDVSANKCK